MEKKDERELIITYAGRSELENVVASGEDAANAREIIMDALQEEVSWVEINLQMWTVVVNLKLVEQISYRTESNKNYVKAGPQK